MQGYSRLSLQVSLAVGMGAIAVLLTTAYAFRTKSLSSEDTETPRDPEVESTSDSGVYAGTSTDDVIDENIIQESPNIPPEVNNGTSNENNNNHDDGIMMTPELQRKRYQRKKSTWRKLKPSRIICRNR